MNAIDRVVWKIPYDWWMHIIAYSTQPIPWLLIIWRYKRIYLWNIESHLTHNGCKKTFIYFRFECRSLCSCYSVASSHYQAPLQWRHNELDGVSKHQPHDCLLNRLFRRRSKKTSKLRVTGLCAGNSSGTGEFPTQRASNAENVTFDDVIMEEWKP